jgi:hypothetical protein
VLYSYYPPVFSYFHRIPGAILWYFLMTLMILLGYILLIIPGIYLSFAYMFSLPLMIEKDMTAWQALEVSRKAVTRIWFRATGFLLLVVRWVVLAAIADRNRSSPVLPVLLPRLPGPVFVALRVPCATQKQAH